MVVQNRERHLDSTRINSWQVSSSLRADLHRFRPYPASVIASGGQFGQQ